MVDGAEVGARAAPCLEGGFGSKVGTTVEAGILLGGPIGRTRQSCARKDGN